MCKNIDIHFFFKSIRFCELRAKIHSSTMSICEQTVSNIRDENFVASANLITKHWTSFTSSEKNQIKTNLELYEPEFIKRANKNLADDSHRCLREFEFNNYDDYQTNSLKMEDLIRQIPDDYDEGFDYSNVSKLQYILDQLIFIEQYERMYDKYCS
jgi:hypothetical protein